MPDARMTTPRLMLAVFAVWLLAAAILIGIGWDRIVTLAMWDPDDYLRLQQVRDWLGGQAFLDVTQYRIDPPHGVAMHWSRIVDLPLAGLILLLQPLLGGPLAERVTVTVVPLLIFGGILAGVALVTARLADRRAALIAAMLAGATPLMLYQVMPLRIDHHGWQTMLGLAALAACFDRKARRGGALAGAASALWLAISLEALPMVAAIAAVLGMRFVIDGGMRGGTARFRAFLDALTIVGVLLYLGLHPSAAWPQNHCDAVSPGWLGPLALAPGAASLLLPSVERRGPVMRLALLGGAAGFGIAALAIVAPACLGGPFAALDPVVRLYWYDNVLEGLPIWRQPIDNRAILIGFPLVGLAGTLIGWRRAYTLGEERNWLAMLVLMLAALAVALFVQRAGALAHAYALPGAGFLLGQLLDAIGRWRRALLRVLASTAAIIGLSPVGAVAVSSFALSAVQPGHAADVPPPSCARPCDRFAALNRLPPAYILTGLDLAPRLLVNTPHRYAGSSHHRDVAAIRRVLDAFLGPPAVAHRIMAGQGMDYVLIDPAGNEAMIYRNAAPHGLMADLLRGRAPPWLEPVPLHGSPFRMWRRVD